jgi:zinc protease
VELWGVSGNAPGEIHKSLQTVLVNLVGNPLFTPESVVVARQEQERAALFERDSLVDAAMEALRARAFGGSEYGISALGFPDRLTSVKAEMLSQHYSRYFRPNRCVVVVAGKVRVDEMRRKVEASFGAGGLRADPPAPDVPTIRVRPIPVGLRDVVLERSAPATLFAMGWLAPGTASQANEAENRKTYITLALLDAVLGGGKAARLFHELRDVTPVGYDVRTTLITGRGSSLWCAYVVGKSDVDTYRTALTDQIAVIAEGKRPITESELTRAGAYLKTKHLQSGQRIRDRAFGAGWAEIMGLGATYDTDYDRYLDAVTVEDVNQLARRLFNANAATVLSRSPLPIETTE